MLPEKVSKRISVLRVILLVFIVFIHNNSTVIGNAAFSYWVKTLFSEILVRMAVPLYFLISGFLLFRKQENYGKMLKKKAKTLLVPYLLWNAIVIAMFWIGQNAPYISRFFTDENNLISQYTLFRWLDAFLGLNYHGYPAAYQLWFIRDLMVLTLLYPVWRWLLQRFPVATFAVLISLWLLEWRVVFWDGEATLFFLLGAWLVQHDPGMEKLDSLKIHDILAGYMLCVILEMGLVMSDRTFIAVHKIVVLMGGVLWLRLSKKIVAHNGLYTKINAFGGYTFFVYAFHEPMLTMMRKVWTALIGNEGTAIQMIQYFSLIFLAIAISLCAGWCLRRISPKLYGLLTGGRA